jgi:hypothetical protein
MARHAALLDAVSLEILLLDWRGFVSFHAAYGSAVLNSDVVARRAYWVVGQELPNRSPPPSLQLNNTDNVQQPPENSTVVQPPPLEHTWITMLPQDLGADIFKGQIITIAVVIVFLTIFLLREWIIQNARPGVFGDEEVLEGGAAPPEGVPANAAQEPGVLDDIPPLEAVPPADAPAVPLQVVEVDEEEGGDDEDEPEGSDVEQREAFHPNDPDEEDWEDESDMGSESGRGQWDEDTKSTSSYGKGKQREADESGKCCLMLLRL